MRGRGVRSAAVAGLTVALVGGGLVAWSKLRAPATLAAGCAQGSHRAGGSAQSIWELSGPFPVSFGPVCGGGAFLVAVWSSCPTDHVQLSSLSGTVIRVSGAAYPPAKAGNMAAAVTRVTLAPGYWSVTCASPPGPAGEMTIVGPRASPPSLSRAASAFAALESRTGCPARIPCDYRAYLDGIDRLALPPAADFDVQQLRAQAMSRESCPSCVALASFIAFDAAVREDLGLEAGRRGGGY